MELHMYKWCSSRDNKIILPFFPIFVSMQKKPKTHRAHWTSTIGNILKVNVERRVVCSLKREKKNHIDLPVILSLN